MRRTDARVLGLIALLAAALLQIGCSGATRVNGRVVSGPVGLAVAVDAGDERLQEPGIAGVEVALLRETSGSAGSLITKAVTDEEGNFRMTLARGAHPGGAVIVRARGDAVYTSRSKAYLPRGNQVLLCTVMTRPDRADP